MRITKLLTTATWRYAVGEVLLIVLGVSIALAATSWYEEREEHRREIESLLEVRATLEADFQNISEYESTTRKRVEHLLALLSHLESTAPYTVETSVSVGWLPGWRGVRIRAAPFEALKENGLSLISNDTLRFRLISLYEDEFASLKASSERSEDFVVKQILPYFIVNFRLDESQRWVPHDYEQIKNEGQVANMARWKVFTTENYLLPRYEQTLKSIEEILVLIDDEVAAEH